MTSSPNIAIIPAKKTSTRLPNKNIRPFFGHPAVAYSIMAAINSQLFDRVIVSTDDPLTGEIAVWYGAEYLPRPAYLADDKASLVDVCLHMIDSLGLASNPNANLCQLMPNCPLRNSKDILHHHQLFTQHQRSFQISVVPYRGVYPHWALRADSAGQGSWMFDSKYLINSQELATAYCPTGAIWWVQLGAFLEQKAFYGTPFHLALLDGNQGMDIDHAAEYDLLDLIIRGLTDRDGVNPLEAISIEPFPSELLPSIH